ncbi:ATP-grasp domain-containing protein [Micromonospora sp. NPDC007230]|uniref:ATP-grasp domain-containing protein n=1 Tax=Micromonospora sp. NPDC007230 TaxID=3364237 RepID=UPI0036B6495C
MHVILDANTSPPPRHAPGGSTASALIRSHPDTPNDLPPVDVDLIAIAPLVAASGLPFVSVDLALRADGVWRVVELGDGQVSDRPTSVDPHGVVTALLTDTR